MTIREVRRKLEAILRTRLNPRVSFRLSSVALNGHVGYKAIFINYFLPLRIREHFFSHILHSNSRVSCNEIILSVREWEEALNTIEVEPETPVEELDRTTDNIERELRRVGGMEEPRRAENISDTSTLRNRPMRAEWLPSTFTQALREGDEFTDDTIDTTTPEPNIPEVSFTTGLAAPDYIIEHNPYTDFLSTPPGMARQGRPLVWGKCEKCSKREKIKDLIPRTIDSYVCCDCIIIHYLECSLCGIYHRKDRTWVMDNKNYCGDCFSRVGFHCTGCDTNYPGANSTWVGGHFYCNSCRDCLLSKCNICNEFEEDVSFITCDTCERTFCRNCRHNHENQCSFREIGDNPVFIDGNPDNSFFKFNRYVSAEIEVEKGELKNLQKDIQKEAGIVRDGSLSNKGVEIQTPPATFDALEKIIRDCSKVLKNHGYKGTVNCGLHLHFDARDIINDHIKIVQVIKTFYAVEDIIYSMLPPSRWGTSYCQQLNKNYLYDNFKKKMKKSDVEKSIYKVTNMREVGQRKSHKYDSLRYYGLNIHSIFYRGTIELRYHSGTVEDYKILRWIEIASRIIDYSINHYKEKEVKELFDLETGYEKWKKFKTLFKLPNDVIKYMDGRLRKFNFDFRIKFNQGKVVREEEGNEIRKKKKIIEKKVNELYPLIYEETKREFAGPMSMGIYDIKDIARERTTEQIKNELPPNYLNLPMSSGFIRDGELNSIRMLMETGRRLANTQDNGADEPEI